MPSFNRCTIITPYYLLTPRHSRQVNGRTDSTYICIVHQTIPKMWGEIIDPYPNLNGYTVRVWELISDFIPHCTMGAITYPCWNPVLPLGFICSIKYTHTHTPTTLHLPSTHPVPPPPYLLESYSFLLLLVTLEVKVEADVELLHLVDGGQHRHHQHQAQEQVN